ncbi:MULTISPECIES: CsbD family protein [Streptomyces]|uniref:CsbD family protein n=1 Tax=Streptomyces pratisoli TaxID=3139917 RepID=A0ACC6QBT7_9ACTN|nr:MULTISPECIES: CsbD family protein [unclassified Streptomyces]MCX4510434.1 CsbD family protein [Streptomyces sp. NBC_01619]
MGKAKAKAKQAKGKMKETAGKAMGDREMQAEGRGEQMAGKAREATQDAAERMKRPQR